MAIPFRKLHRSIAPIVFLPLLISAVTGVVFQVGSSWLGLPTVVSNLMLTIHQGAYLGAVLNPVYVLLVGLGLLGMIVTGFTMFRFTIFRRRVQLGVQSDGNRDRQLRSSNTRHVQRPNVRQVHRWLTPLFFIPLTISAITGIVYRIGSDWFGMSSQYGAIVLSIHRGMYLGSGFTVVYVSGLALGLLAILWTGINMTRLFRRRHSSSGTER